MFSQAGTRSMPSFFFFYSFIPPQFKTTHLWEQNVTRTKSFRLTNLSSQTWVILASGTSPVLYNRQQSFAICPFVSLEAVSLVDGTSIAGFSVKKSAGLKWSWNVSTGLQLGLLVSRILLSSCRHGGQLTSPASLHNEGYVLVQIHSIQRHPRYQSARFS